MSDALTSALTVASDAGQLTSDSGLVWLASIDRTQAERERAEEQQTAGH